MESIFDKENINLFIERIKNINENSSKQWGKMTSYQMLRHCILNEEMYLGKTSYKRLFIGRIFGKMSLKSMVKNEAPLKKNEPTHPDFKITDSGELSIVKEKFISLLKEYENSSDKQFSNFVHPFFGKMNKEQIGIASYKHTDHHLRQFGV